MCAICQTTLSGRQTKYCSPLCRSRALTAARRADGRKRAYDQRVVAEGNAYQRRRNAGLTGLPIVDCAACGTPTGKVAVAGLERRVCSSMCRAYLRHGKWPQCAVPVRRSARRIEAARRLAIAAKGTTGGRVRWTCGSCYRCASPFAVITCGPNVPAYCSKPCSQADVKARRRARTRGVKLTPGRRHAVFDRDEWRCRICGDEVDRLATVPDLAAPTVDHRVPLAAGGEHGPDNWQTAHFYCNSVKRDTNLTMVA